MNSPQFPATSWSIVAASQRYHDPRAAKALIAVCLGWRLFLSYLGIP